MYANDIPDDSSTAGFIHMFDDDTTVSYIRRDVN